jgi:hypothetical protein
VCLTLKSSRMEIPVWSCTPWLASSVASRVGSTYSASNERSSGGTHVAAGRCPRAPRQGQAGLVKKQHEGGAAQRLLSPCSEVKGLDEEQGRVGDHGKAMKCLRHRPLSSVAAGPAVESGRESGIDWAFLGPAPWRGKTGQHGPAAHWNLPAPHGSGAHCSATTDVDVHLANSDFCWSALPSESSRWSFTLRRHRLAKWWMRKTQSLRVASGSLTMTTTNQKPLKLKQRRREFHSPREPINATGPGCLHISLCKLQHALPAIRKSNTAFFFTI